MFKKTPDSSPNPEKPQYRSQTIDLGRPFNFGQTFYEVEPGVIDAAETLASKLKAAAKIAPYDLKTTAVIMREFSNLAILSQHMAQAKIETKPTDDRNINLETIKVIIKNNPPSEKMPDLHQYLQKKLGKNKTE